MKRIGIVIVNFNAKPLLDACLASVYRSQDVEFDVSVVDNASDDGSSQMVRERYPQATIIEHADNRGFAYANNQALQAWGFTDDGAAEPDDGYPYVLLLNPDTELPADGLAKAVAYMDAHQDVGVVGAKLLKPDGTLDLACRRSFPAPGVAFYRMVGLSRLFPRSKRFGRYNLTYLDPDETAEVDAVAGAFMLVRAEAIRQAGLLDERFFMYGEDLDWALRMKQQGWKVVYYPEVVVLHHKGGSSQRNRSKVVTSFYRSMLLFYEKHYAKSMLLPLHWCILLAIHLQGAGAFIRHLIGSVGNLNPKRPRANRTRT